MRSRFWADVVAGLMLVGGAAGVARGQASPGDVPTVSGPLAVVNVMQGTNSTSGLSHGNTLPLIGTPWGMTDWSVQNNGDVHEGWFYHSEKTKFVGFRATHQPSPWMGDYCQFMILPQTGDAVLSPRDRACDYDPKQTVMRPDYARVRLDRYHVTAELTASERCAVLRLQFDPADKVGRIVFDVAGNGELKAEGKKVTGFARSGGRIPREFANTFVAELDRRVTKVQALAQPDAPAQAGQNNRRNNRPDKLGYIEFDISQNPVVELRIGMSYLGEEQAARNLAAETEGGFDATRQRTAGDWDKQLNRIAIEADDDQQATFYTCLYRAMKFPHKVFEIGADGKPTHLSAFDGKVHAGVAYADSGLWDTFRTQFPFLSIAYPDQLGEIVDGWLNAYREGGWLPQWPSPGGFRGMPGSHADSMVADAMSKKIKGFDYETAYAALRRDAFDLPVRGKPFGGRGALGEYLRLGYVTQKGSGSSVSETLDYVYDDWCVAQAAKLTGHEDDYRALMARSQNYSKLWDPETKFMRPKNEKAEWDDKGFDEFYWGGPYTEGGPWQTSFGVYHDLGGLAKLAGGREAFISILDRLFGTPPIFHPGGYHGVIHEMTEFADCDMGQYASNNQPGFHTPYMYLTVGQPWKTEYWTRRACRELFSAGPDGYSGDEDNGSNACWYLLSSIGLYPLTPGQPTYALTSPAFKSVTINLPEGKTFKIQAQDNSRRNVYVKTRTLDGKPYTNLWISQEQLMAGGTLGTKMTDVATERTVKSEELPYSAMTEMTAGGMMPATAAK
ncbi:MAG: alpha 2-mannosidase [Phycisphaerales bacterium]|nr:alpha 2-mannosidase [Phycisphaerales bacterium]